MHEQQNLYPEKIRNTNRTKEQSLSKTLIDGEIHMSDLDRPLIEQRILIT